MGSNGRDQTTQHHPPHISSLVVRPPGSNDEEAGRHASAEDISHDRPSFARSDRHKGDDGHRTRASSTSPARRLYEDHRHASDLDHSGVPLRGCEFSSRREAFGRDRDYSPPYARGGAGARPLGRGFDGPELAHGSFKTEGMGRNNNSKVQPRDGDWYCLDPLCRNLNFARRECCFKCKKHRYAHANSPPLPRSRLRPPPMNISPRRDFNGYRSPPRGWPRDYPPPPRHDYPTWRDRDRERDRQHYSDLDHPPSRRIASDWAHTEPNPKPYLERRPPPFSPPSPPLPLSRSEGWGQLSRERSRSPPMRNGPPLLRDYHRDSYYERRGREDRRRNRMENDY